MLVKASSPILLLKFCLKFTRKSVAHFVILLDSATLDLCLSCCITATNATFNLAAWGH
jgi:hypothetical protein